MPDTSQLITNESFTNDNNTNKFILIFPISNYITKKQQIKKVNTY